MTTFNSDSSHSGSVCNQEGSKKSLGKLQKQDLNRKGP